MADIHEGGGPIPPRCTLEREPGGGPGARLKRDEAAVMWPGDRALRAPLSEGPSIGELNALEARRRRQRRLWVRIPLPPHTTRGGRLARTRTPDFHSGNAGSNPARPTNYQDSASWCSPVQHAWFSARRSRVRILLTPRTISSVGRAGRLQRQGREFDPLIVHGGRGVVRSTRLVVAQENGGPNPLGHPISQCSSGARHTPLLPG